uniref:Uncharacterized protein n=1 Tax=Rhizophora mucronata TaxID=61149 RepID=A0A2P2PY22_RHIMU
MIWLRAGTVSICVN